MYATATPAWFLTPGSGLWGFVGILFAGAVLYLVVSAFLYWVVWPLIKWLFGF